MRLSFICNYIHINDGWSPWDTRVGGTEECIIQWADRLAQRGHEVQVFHNGKHGMYKGVAYRPHAEYMPGDITINVNYPQFQPVGRTVYYSTLTDNPDLALFDAVMCLSQYAKDNTNLPHRAIIVPPGYDHTAIYPGQKIAGQCFYASSPDRGLDILLEAWPIVMSANSDATLLVTYGGHIDLPGVINLGETDEETMNDVYRTSDIWCHPCTGGELYCMVGKKAQAAGCIPVIIPTMALAETVERGFKVGKPEDYAQSLIEVLNLSMDSRNHIRKDIEAHANAATWEESTDMLLKVIENVLQ